MIKVDIKKQLDEILEGISGSLNRFYGLGQEIEGALGLGTRIEKINSDNGDHNPNGTKGTVYGVLDGVSGNHSKMKYMYSVVFDKPNIDDQLRVSLIVDYKIKPLERE
jgi:hypothetical protein